MSGWNMHGTLAESKGKTTGIYCNTNMLVMCSRLRHTNTHMIQWFLEESHESNERVLATQKTPGGRSKQNVWRSIVRPRAQKVPALIACGGRAPRLAP